MFASAFDWLSQHAAVLVLVNLSLGLFGVPGVTETLLLTAGVAMARAGGIPWTIVLATALGSAIGMTICFEAGRLGDRLLLERFASGRRSQRLVRAQQWAHRFGPWSIVLTFFTPGLRHITATAVGTTALEFRRFISFSVVGACLWTSVLLSCGYVLGHGTPGSASPSMTRYLAKTVRRHAILERVHAAFHKDPVHEVRRLRGDAPRPDFVTTRTGSPNRWTS